LAGALVALGAAAALAFFTVFILYTSFPRSVTFNFRVYVEEVTTVSREVALRSQTSLAAKENGHEEITGNRTTAMEVKLGH
jgi:hypothetical protein